MVKVASLPMIKANAYGHGILRTVAALDRADGFALLELDAALQLRDSGISKPLLLIEGFFGPDELEVFSTHGLTAVVHDAAQLRMLEMAGLDNPNGSPFMVGEKQRDWLRTGRNNYL